MKSQLAIAITLLGGGCASDHVAASSVAALRETAPMSGQGDRADDPAVWASPLDVDHSLILGTNKDWGLYVYNLSGEELQRLAVGQINNVDLRGNLAVASNDGVNALSWFRIDPMAARVSHVGDTKLERIEPYGVCLGVVDDVLRAAVTFKNGAIDLWTVHDGGMGPVTISDPKTIMLGSQLEGCVFDDEAGRLFVGEENVGLWAIELATGAKARVDSVNRGTGLVADVEGVSLYAGEGGAGYVIVSAQSKDRYIVYDRTPPHALIGVIAIAASADGRVDGVSHTDGLDATSAPLPGLPAGVLVVQDDANPVSEVDQNFKIVDWRHVEQALKAAN
jgi:3-phytase